MAHQKVLLADSSRFFRTIESKFLQNTPVEVLESDSPETTLAAVEASTPDLVFLAYDLAAAGDPPLCSVLKNHLKVSRIPVVVICDQGAPGQVEQARLMGADMCMSKPLDRQGFLQVGRTFIDSIREYRQPSFFALKFILNGVEHKGKCLDISTGGMFIESHEDIPSGSVIDLDFKLPDGMLTPIRCRGEVTWLNRRSNPMKSHYPFGFGVRFTALPEMAQKAIQRLAEKQARR